MLEKVRSRVLGFVDKYKEFFFFIIITVFAVYVRSKMMDFISGDMYWCLKEWFNTLKEGGGLAALKDNIGNYNVPYLFFLALFTYLPFEYSVTIKVFSIIFDFAMAFAIMVLVRKILKDKPSSKYLSVLAYGIVLFLPSVSINSAYWGQCDSIYTFFVILSIIYLTDNKYIKSFVFLGVACAFKMQFIFVLPVYVLYYLLNKKYSILCFVLIVIVNIILCTPALIAGKNIKDIVNIYKNQTTEYSSYISMNKASVYNLFLKPSEDTLTHSPSDAINKLGIVSCVVIFGITAYSLMNKKIKLNTKQILLLAIWSIMICNFILPSMHERYGYMADILSVAFFIIYNENLYLAVALNTISLCEYSIYLFNNLPIPMYILSIAYLIVLVYFSNNIFKKEFFNVNEIENKNA